MLNKQTIKYMNNSICNSTIKFNINKTSLNNQENENTASKNLFTKRTPDLNTRNALASINEICYTLKKSEIINLKLIGQFDKKFCVFYRSDDKSIIFFDQHAVHERVLYEYYQELLLNEFYLSLNSNNDSILSSTPLYNPRKYKINSNDVKLNLFTDIYGKYILKKIISVKCELFKININNFNNSCLYDKNSKIQIFFNFSWSYKYENDIISFYSVPIIFDKIHKIEVLLALFAYLINNLDEFWKSYKNNERNVLNPFDNIIRSKACRNAVKFNDELENNYIKELINELSLCNNPFLCAHGRHNYFIKYKKK